MTKQQFVRSVWLGIVGSILAILIIIGLARADNNRWLQAQERLRQVDVSSKTQASIVGLLEYVHDHPGKNEAEILNRAKWIANYDRPIFNTVIKTFCTQDQRTFQDLVHKAEGQKS